MSNGDFPVSSMPIITILKKKKKIKREGGNAKQNQACRVPSVKQKVKAPEICIPPG